MTLLQLLVVSAIVFSISEGYDKYAVVKAIDKLGIDIHRKLSAEDDGNLFNSPLGISIILAMLYYGSCGKAAAELERGLGYQYAGISGSEVHASFKSLIEALAKDSEAKEYCLGVASAVLTQKGYPIVPEYKHGLLTNYNATAQEVDFQNEGTEVVAKINDWVKRKTNNRIKKLFDCLDPSTVIVLLNVVFFQGAWNTPFDPQDTTDQVFYNQGLHSKQTTIQMMHLIEELHYRRIREAQLIELPFKGENIAMIIVLPDALDGAYKVEQELTPAESIELLKGTKKINVHLSLPKFKLEVEENLNKVLQELGIKRVFENSADLSGISKVGPIAVSQVVHKVAIEANEGGCGTPGATGMATETRKKFDGIEFVVDHPFLLATYDKRTNAIYFKGRVSKL